MSDYDYDLLVIGSGPGGQSAALQVRSQISSDVPVKLAGTITVVAKTRLIWVSMTSSKLPVRS